MNTQNKSFTTTEIQTWLINYLSEFLEIDSSEMDISVTFDRYGLDSAAAVGMISDLETWMGYEIDPTLPFEYPNIKALSEHLAEEINLKI